MKTDLNDRTLAFALRVIRFVDGFQTRQASWVIGNQSLRSATSIGANYREAGRAESKADFVHKVGIAEKEAAETEYWLQLCEQAGIGPSETPSLLDETRQLIAIFTAIGRNAKRR